VHAGPLSKTRCQWWVLRAAFDYAPPRLHGHLLVSWRALTLKSFNISHTARRAQVFHGVPFAAPPEGDLRWSPPRAPDKWILPRPAILTRPVCEWRQPSDQPTPCLSCASHTLWQQIFEQQASRTHACRAHHTPCSCSAGLSSATRSRCLSCASHTVLTQRRSQLSHMVSMRVVRITHHAHAAHVSAQPQGLDPERT
jgi:hypothetical protein